MADAEIDITREQCPMTFVRVKLQLEAMEPGQQLRIHLRSGESLASISRALKLEGYALDPPQMDGELCWLVVEKPHL
ncbi:MAG: sulfurtransferase TusA family protein [Magnetococcales bacterium]|nr:sulfurtransferase TusA family protein [Magnetococcales bacterium]